MVIQRIYGIGTGADVVIPIQKAGSNDFALAADWTPAAGDVKISKDNAASANIGTLPASTIDRQWKFVFTDAELQAKLITVVLHDAAGAAVEDQYIYIETKNHHSAMHPNGVIRRATAQAIAAGTLTLDASASAVNDEYNGMAVLIVSATTGTGQMGYISDYDGSSKVATLASSWKVTPTGTVVFAIYPNYDVQAAIANLIVEGAVTLAHSLQLANAANAGKVDGAGAGIVHLRDLDDTKNRVTAEVDGLGNRSVVTPSYD